MQFHQTYSNHKIALLFCLLINSLSSYAESNSSSDNSEVLLDEVVVTGQKISRSRQDTVESVTVYDFSDLEQKAKSDDFYELLDQTANVSREGSFAFQVRGISVNGPSNADDGARSIAFIVDDAALGIRALQQGALSLWDMDRAEILRGAQSTTIGRNALAGAFVLKSADPEFESNGRAKISYGNFNTYQAAVAQTGPLSEKLAYRFSLDHKASDNFSKNSIFNSKDWDREESTTARAKLKYITDEDAELLFTVSTSKFDDRGDDTIHDDYNKRVSRENYDNRWITDTDIVSLNYTKDISEDWGFTSKTAFSNTEFDRASDLDGPAETGSLIQLTKSDDMSQELLFNYDKGNEKTVIGIYVAKGTLDDKFTSNDLAFDLGGINPGFAGVNAFLKVDVASEERFKNIAMFYNSDIKLSEKLTFMHGLRFDYEERRNSINAQGVRSRNAGPLNATLDALLPGLGGSSDDKAKFTSVLPKIGLDYKWSDNINTGFVIQRGYRPGGISVNPVQGNAKEFDPEFTTNYELSLRTSNDDKSLTFNTNLFYVDWRDQQVRIQQGASPYDVTVKNASSSNLKGAEFEMSYDINTSFNVSLNAGYTKTEFEKFKPRNTDFSGNEFRFARKWTGGISGTYNHESGFFANTQLSHSSNAWSNIANTIRAGSFKLWNAKFGYEQDNWRASTYINNILDDTYITEQYVQLNNTNSYVLGAPRTYGANLEIFW